MVARGGRGLKLSCIRPNFGWFFSCTLPIWPWDVVNVFYPLRISSKEDHHIFFWFFSSLLAHSVSNWECTSEERNMVCPYSFCKQKEALDDCCDMQRRGGRSSGDVQVLRLDDDGQGSRTEYMKVITNDSHILGYDTKSIIYSQYKVSEDSKVFSLAWQWGRLQKCQATFSI